MPTIVYGPPSMTCTCRPPPSFLPFRNLPATPCYWAAWACWAGSPAGAASLASIKLQQLTQGPHQGRAFVRTADADAQKLADAWRIEVAHDHGTRAQARRQLRRIVLRMVGKDKIGLRRQDLEAHSGQFKRQLFAAVDHGLPRLLEIDFVTERRHGAGQRQAVQRIGIETVLDPLQRFDQVRVAQRETHAQTSQ